MLKLYWTLWAAFAAMGLLLWATGNFTMLTLVGFGFVSFGMIFMGMISVLPATVVHHAVPAEPKVKPAKVRDENADGLFHANPLATR